MDQVCFARAEVLESKASLENLGPPRLVFVLGFGAFRAIYFGAWLNHPLLFGFWHVGFGLGLRLLGTSVLMFWVVDPAGSFG